ncbi:hypothetical protein H5U35_00175 [Candidatus Aerophobetes bacterium]|nr:hypothetical protein [Candidatus Aerophobetes bacterium]
MLSAFARKIALNFPETVNFLPKWCRKKSFVTGNPIREEIITTSRNQGIKRLGLADNKFCILFLGGSQGASFLNKVAIDTLFLIQEEKWREEIQYILLTGEKDYLWVLGEIKKLRLQGKVFSYLSEISFALAVADLVVSRSGATTISEILARGIPCILIPYPFATSQHQLTNALYLKDREAAEVIVQEKLTAQVLKEKIRKIYFDKQLRERMKKASNLLGKPDATDKVSKLILSLVK